LNQENSTPQNILVRDKCITQKEINKEKREIKIIRPLINLTPTDKIKVPSQNYINKNNVLTPKFHQKYSNQESIIPREKNLILHSKMSIALALSQLQKKTNS